MEEKRWIIRIGDKFVNGFNGKQQPLCVDVPSAALRFDYRQADELVQVLRGKTYEAFVTNALGVPATLEVIQRELGEPERF
jgi:hypothetical protein